MDRCDRSFVKNYFRYGFFLLKSFVLQNLYRMIIKNIYYIGHMYIQNNVCFYNLNLFIEIMYQIKINE